MPGPRWRSAAAGWLRSAADSLSPAPEASAPDPGPYDSGYYAPPAAAAGSRGFDLGEAPEHWVKLLRDAGLVAGGHGVGKPGPTTPAAADSAGPARQGSAPPVPGPAVPGSAQPGPAMPGSAEAGPAEAGTLRAGSADAGSATGEAQAARGTGAGAGGHRPRAAGDRRIPQLLIGRRTAGSLPVVQEQATNQQAPDPQSLGPQSLGPQAGRAGRAGSASGTGTARDGRLIGAEAILDEGPGMAQSGSVPGPTPPGESAHTSQSHRRSPQGAVPTPASEIHQPARRALPPAWPAEPPGPELPGLSGPQMRSGLWGVPARSPSAAAPSGEGTVSANRAAVVVPRDQAAAVIPHQPAPNRHVPSHARPERPLDVDSVQYPGPRPPAKNLPSALAGEWPELPATHAGPAMEAAPKIEQALTRNLRLRDEQQAV